MCICSLCTLFTIQGGGGYSAGRPERGADARAARQGAQEALRGRGEPHDEDHHQLALQEQGGTQSLNHLIIIIIIIIIIVRQCSTRMFTVWIGNSWNSCFRFGFSSTFTLIADLRSRAHLERLGRARQDPLPVAHGQGAAGLDAGALDPHKGTRHVNIEQ